MEPLWADLLNSDWHDYRGSGRREDRLGNDAWLRTFLARTGWEGEQLPEDQERETLRQLRGLLRRLVDSVRTGGEPGATDIATLNRVLAAAPVVHRLEHTASGTRLVLASVASGIDRVCGVVAAAFASVLAEGEPERIKICANPDCAWVMYDTSRNRTRRWCDKTECGNLIKVRRHRNRKREDTGRKS